MIYTPSTTTGPVAKPIDIVVTGVGGTITSPDAIFSLSPVLDVTVSFPSPFETLPISPVVIEKGGTVSLETKADLEGGTAESTSYFNGDGGWVLGPIASYPAVVSDAGVTDTVVTDAFGLGLAFQMPTASSNVPFLEADHIVVASNSALAPPSGNENLNNLADRVLADVIWRGFDSSTSGTATVAGGVSLTTLLLAWDDAAQIGRTISFDGSNQGTVTAHNHPVANPAAGDPAHKFSLTTNFPKSFNVTGLAFTGSSSGNVTSVTNLGGGSYNMTTTP